MRILLISLYLYLLVVEFIDFPQNLNILVGLLFSFSFLSSSRRSGFDLV